MEHSIAQELPRLPLESWRKVAEGARAERAPLIIAGVFSDSAAVKNWTPATFVEKFGDSRIHVAVDLPADRSPYLDSHESHSAAVSIRELVDRIDAGERCYLNQASMQLFGDMANDIDLSLITTPPVFGVNLWLGGPTRSGLHYDSADNFLVQIFGQKRCVLIAPPYARSVSPIPDTPSKSGLSPHQLEGPDEGPFATVPRWRGTITPGDALFIPRGWWHYLASLDRSISLNVWHGDRLGFKDYCQSFFRSGPAVWTRVARDFVWCGFLRRPYRQRLFSPAPLGVELHRRVVQFRWR